MKELEQNIIDRFQKEIDNIDPADGKKYLPNQVVRIAVLRKAIRTIKDEIKKRSIAKN